VIWPEALLNDRYGLSVKGTLFGIPMLAKGSASRRMKIGWWAEVIQGGQGG